MTMTIQLPPDIEEDGYCAAVGMRLPTEAERVSDWYGETSIRGSFVLRTGTDTDRPITTPMLGSGVLGNDFFALFFFHSTNDFSLASA